MSTPQPGILPEVPSASRYLFLSPAPDGDVVGALTELGRLEIDESLVVGIGEPTLRVLGEELPGLRTHPAWSGKGVSTPSTQAGLWIWLRGDDRGELLHRSRQLVDLLADGFELDEMIEGFRYREGRDLTGYEDGTENPTGAGAEAAAWTSFGASFVAVQRWVHDLWRFESMSAEERDRVIGRRMADNEELDDAPESAHVKRTAQEGFDPPAFVLRRSMAWSDPEGEGLVFVAFGRSLDAYETLLREMLGLNDGVVDALFRFTRPVSGGYYCCPPIREGRLDLGALGIHPAP